MQITIIHVFEAFCRIAFLRRSLAISHRHAHPMSIAVIFLGGLTLGSLALFVLGIHLGLGPGGMERMIVYPVILWGASFGGYLMASERR